MIIDNPKISGSLEVQNHISASDGTITGNLIVQGNVVGTASTASYVESANVDGLTNLSSSIASGLLKNTTDTLTGDLTVTGNITAQEFHTEYVSASVIYESGSTQFGDTLDDTHNFTGSINLTGSLNVNGAEVGTGKLDETVFNSYTSSTDTSIQNLTDETSSYALKAEISGSNTTLSSSVASDIEDILDGTDTVTSASYALTASYADSGAGFPFDGAAIITGSLYVSGSTISGSFVGDGSQLTDIDVSQVSTVTSSFSAVNTLTINHNFNSKNVSVAVYNSSDVQILPAAVTLTDNDNVKIDFAGNTAGYAVVSKGGHIVSGSLSISETGHISDSFTSQTSHTVFHGFNTKEVIVSVYEGDNLIIPDSVTTNNLDSITVSFPEAISGRVVVVKGGHLISGSVLYSNITNKPTLLSGSAQIASDISGSFTSLSSSLESRVSDQENFSSSLDATFATDADLNLVSSSVDSLNAATSSYALANQISGSFTSLSSSIASELLKNTTDTLTGDLTVTGTLTAQDLHVQEVTSSILYSSGSNILGASSSDTQTLYGNVGIGTASNFLGSELDVWGDITLAQQNWGIRGNSGNANFAIEELAGGAFNDSNITLEIISGGNTLITNGWVPTNSSKLVVRGSGTYNSTFSRAGSTIQIISDELSDDTWSPVFNIANIRQSLTTGRDSFGGIGFSSIDDSNNDGMTDAARIALVNESPASVVTPTALAFYTNAGTATTGSATEQMRINSSGDLGIGTTSPSGKLEVSNTTTGIGAIIGNTTHNSRLQIYTAAAGKNSEIWFGDAGDDDIGKIDYDHNDNSLSFSTNAAERMRIDSSGVISIGPSTTSSEIYFNYNNTNNKGGLKIDYSTGELRLSAGESGNGYHQAFYTNGTERMRIESSGNVQLQTVGAQLRFQNSAGAAPYIKNSGENSSTAPYGQNLEFYTGGSKALTLDNSQNATFAGDVTLSAAGSTGEIIRTTDNTEPYLALQRNLGNNGVGVLRLLDGGDLTFDTGATGAGQATRLTIDGSTGNSTFVGNITISKSTPFITLSNTAEDECGIVMLDSADAGQSAKITYDAGSSNALKFYNNASNERMRITSSGNSFFNYSNQTIETYGSGVYGGKVVIKASGAEGLSLLNNSIGGAAQVAMNFTNEFVANQYNFIARIIAEPEQSWTGDAATRDARLTFFTALNGSAGEKMRITSAGAIGINNSSPDSFNLSGTTSSSLVIGQGTNSISPQLTLWQGNSAQATINFASANTGTGQYEGRIRYTRDTGVMDFRTNGVANVLVLASTGNVGIGTSSPDAKLQVNSATAGNVTGAYFTNSQANSGAEKVSIAFGLNRSGGDFIRSTQAITFGSEQQWTGTPASVRGYLQFNTMQDESEGARMRISSQGLISSQNTVTSHSRRRDYTYTGTVANGDTVDLIENSSAYTDVTFILFMEIFHSGRTYRTIKGSFGGYGLNISSSGSGIGINQQTVATGRAKLRVSNTTGYSAGVHIHAIIIGDSSITVHNGVLATAPQ